MNYYPYHWCLVSECKNTSVKTPGKLWIQVPTDLKMRNTWLKLARRDPKSLSTKAKYYFCEDHFDLQYDMENYSRYKIMGSVKRIRMKPNCVPSRFDCQPDRKRKFTQSEKRTRGAFMKRRRQSIIEEIEKAYNESLSSSQGIPPLENKYDKYEAATQVVPPQLENDMENYIQYKVMGSVKKIKMKPDCLPSKFECRNLGNLENMHTMNVDTAEYLEITMSSDEFAVEEGMTPVERIKSHSIGTRRPTEMQITHDSPSEDSEVEIQRLAKKLTAALTTISVLTKKNGDLTKKNQELAKRVAALEQKNKVMGRQQAVLQKLNEGLARRSLLVEQRSERLRARVVAHGIADAMTDDEEGDEEEPRPPPHTHPHPGTDTEETETADEDWTMSQDSSPEQTDTTSKTRPKPLSNLLRVSHQRNVKIVNIPSTYKLYKSRKTSNTTRGKRSRHNSVTNKNARMETCVEPLVEETRFDEVVSEQADPLSLMTPGDIKIEDDIKIEEPDIEEYIAMTERI